METRVTLTYRFATQVWHYIEHSGASRQIEFLNRTAPSAAQRHAMQAALVQAGFEHAMHGGVPVYSKTL